MPGRSSLPFARLQTLQMPSGVPHREHATSRHFKWRVLAKSVYAPPRVAPWACHFMPLQVAHATSSGVSRHEHATSCHFMPLQVAHATSSGVSHREHATSCLFKCGVKWREVAKSRHQSQRKAIIAMPATRSDGRWCDGCVALMALGWFWWRAWVPVGAVVAVALCVAGVALGNIDLRFAWQVWGFKKNHQVLSKSGTSTIWGQIPKHLPKISIETSKNMPTGWKPNQRFACFYHGVNGVGWGGVGWGDNVHLHFVTYMMLRYCASHIWCYVTVWGGVGWGDNVHLHFVTYMMLRYCASHIWCYVTVWGGVGWGDNVHLHFLTYMMLRYCASHIWCYAAVISSWTAFPHRYDATLL